MNIASPAPRLVKEHNRASLISAFIFYLQASWKKKGGGGYTKMLQPLGQSD